MLIRCKKESLCKYYLYLNDIGDALSYFFVNIQGITK